MVTLKYPEARLSIFFFFNTEQSREKESRWTDDKVRLAGVSDCSQGLDTQQFVDGELQ